MALKGEAKKDYQRKYMKDYMRSKRAVKVYSKPLTDDMLRPILLDPLLRPDSLLRPNPKPIKLSILDDPALRALQGHLPNCPDGKYRPTDAEGNPMYDY